MSEKVLFEMRVPQDEHGAHVEIHTSPEWDAYHNPRRKIRAFREKRKSSATNHLRDTLNSLQNIYDDIYSPSNG